METEVGSGGVLVMEGVLVIEGVLVMVEDWRKNLGREGMESG